MPRTADGPSVDGATHTASTPPTIQTQQPATAKQSLDNMCAKYSLEQLVGVVHRPTAVVSPPGDGATGGTAEGAVRDDEGDDVGV